MNEVTPVSDTGRDVAERRKSSAAHVRAILDNTLDAVMAMDADGVIRFWNPRAERTFGWGRHEAIGQRLVALIVAEGDRERLGQDLARAGAAGGGGGAGGVGMPASTWSIRLCFSSFLVLRFAGTCACR